LLHRCNPLALSRLRDDCDGLAIRRLTGNLSLLPRRCQSNAGISVILGITTATVGKHLERIYPKLGVENRIAAASFATELTRGLITGDHG
jgi:hypothetical protein